MFNRCCKNLPEGAGQTLTDTVRSGEKRGPGATPFLPAAPSRQPCPSGGQRCGDSDPGRSTRIQRRSPPHSV